MWTISWQQFLFLLFFQVQLTPQQKLVRLHRVLVWIAYFTLISFRQYTHRSPLWFALGWTIRSTSFTLWRRHSWHLCTKTLPRRIDRLRRARRCICSLRLQCYQCPRFLRRFVYGSICGSSEPSAGLFAICGGKAISLFGKTLWQQTSQCSCNLRWRIIKSSWTFSRHLTPWPCFRTRKTLVG